MTFQEAIAVLGLAENAGPDAAREAYVLQLKEHLAGDDAQLKRSLRTAYERLRTVEQWEGRVVAVRRVSEVIQASTDTWEQATGVAGRKSMTTLDEAAQAISTAFAARRSIGGGSESVVAESSASWIRPVNRGPERLSLAAPPADADARPGSLEELAAEDPFAPPISRPALGERPATRAPESQEAAPAARPRSGMRRATAEVAAPPGPQAAPLPRPGRGPQTTRAPSGVVSDQGADPLGPAPARRPSGPTHPTPGGSPGRTADGAGRAAALTPSGAFRTRQPTGDSGGAYGLAAEAPRPQSDPGRRPGPTAAGTVDGPGAGARGPGNPPGGTSTADLDALRLALDAPGEEAVAALVQRRLAEGHIDSAAWLAIRALEATQRAPRGPQALPARHALRLALQLAQAAHVSQAREVLTALDLCHQAIDEARGVETPRDPRWALTRELCALPADFPAGLRTTLAKAAQAGGLSRAEPSIRAWASHHPADASAAHRVLAQHAPGLQQHVGPWLGVLGPAPAQAGGFRAQRQPAGGPGAGLALPKWLTWPSWDEFRDRHLGRGLIAVLLLALAAWAGARLGADRYALPTDLERLRADICARYGTSPACVFTTATFQAASEGECERAWSTLPLVAENITARPLGESPDQGADGSGDGTPSHDPQAEADQLYLAVQASVLVHCGEPAPVE